MIETTYSPTEETWTDPTGKTWPVRIRHQQVGKLITFGRGGHTEYYGRTRMSETVTMNARCSGYDEPQDWFATGRWWAHDYASRVEPADYEGVTYVDMRAAVETAAGVHMVLAGPMVNVDLEPEQVNRCPEPSAIMAAALCCGDDNSFGTMLAVQRQQRDSGAKYGALDHVDVMTYLRLWQEVGAEVGFIRGGQFVPATEPL